MANALFALNTILMAPVPIHRLNHPLNLHHQLLTLPLPIPVHLVALALLAAPVVAVMMMVVPQAVAGVMAITAAIMVAALALHPLSARHQVPIIHGTLTAVTVIGFL